MERLVADLVLAVFAAFVGGLVAQRLGQPVILGYLLAGVAIGPFTPGPTADIHAVGILSEIGVAFLMFALGAEFSIAELRRLGRIGSVGGGLQIAGTMALGPLIAVALGLTFFQGIFLGALIALSSTVVVLKILMSRGELTALHGRVAIGMLIAQDLAVVPMVVVLPTIAGGGDQLLTDLGMAGGKALGVLVAVYLVGIRLVPWMLNRTAILQSRELFLLAIVALALGTALLTEAAGLSVAFGAFLAGLVVGESEYRTQVVAEVLPLRDLFASLFFVSVGMLINPATLVTQMAPIGLLTIAAVVGKVLIVTAVVLALGMPGRVALLTALSLGQIGEFSFVLARLGVGSGALTPELFDVTLGTALITITLTPFLVAAAPRLHTWVVRLPLLGHLFRDPVEPDKAAAAMRGHTVICGFGRIGRELADALDARGLRYLVVEYNPQIVGQLRALGTPVVYGDASNPAVLAHAHLESARLLAVLMPDAGAAELATRGARALAPRLDIVARGRNIDDVERLRRAGASAVVQPEFEAGVEVIHHTLQRYGIVGAELAAVTAGHRAGFYSRQPNQPP